MDLFLRDKIITLTTCESTNTYLMDLSKQGAKEGTVVISNHQTAGKGRLGRTWFTSQGSLAISVLLRPHISVHQVSRLTFLTAWALLQTLQAKGLEVYVKWPNDLVIKPPDFKKVAGILVETSCVGSKVDTAVVGVGINLVRPPVGGDLCVEVPHAGYLSDLDSGFQTAGFVLSFLEHLENVLADLENESVFAVCLNGLRQHSATLGRQIRVEQNGQAIYGRALDFNPDGSLLIERANGHVETIFAGDVWAV